VSTGFLRSDASVPSSAFPLPLKGRVRRVVFWILVRVCPLIPPTPFSHTGRRRRLGVLKPKTGEGTQAPPPGCAGVPSQGERSWARCVVCCIPVHVCPLIPPTPFLSSVEFLGEMSDVLHSHAPLPLFPPTPFSHTGRRGSLGVLMAETGDGTQGLAKKSTPVRYRLGGIAERFTPDGARQPAQADFAFHSRGLYSCGSSRYRISFSIFMFAHRASPA